MSKKFFIVLFTVILFGSFLPKNIFAENTEETAASVPEKVQTFENNDYLSWQKNGDCSLRTVRLAKDDNPDNICLKVDMRRSFWSGPQFNATKELKPGEMYILSIKIYQESGKSEGFDFILKSILSNKEESNTTINTEIKNVPSNRWTELSGPVIIPDKSVESYIYLETTSSNLTYCIDDFSYEKTSTLNSKEYHDLLPSNIITNNEEIIYVASFEDSIPEEWYSNESCRLLLQNSNRKLRYIGHSSMKITNRSSSGDGPVVNISDYVSSNVSYMISCGLYLPNTNSEKMAMTLEYQNSKRETSKLTFATHNIKPNCWTVLSGSVVIPPDTISASIIISSLNTSLKSNSRFNFYVDGFSITTSNAEKKYTENKEEKSADKICYDFEKDDQNISGKDSAVLFPTKDKHHSGKKSVLVSERKSDQSGIIFKMDSLKHNKDYVFSAWISYDIIDSTIKNDHTFFMSVQYYIGNELIYNTIDSCRILNNASWFKLSGKYKIPENAHNISLVINTKEAYNATTQRVSFEKNDLTPFYIDDVNISNSDYLSSRNTIIRIVIGILSALSILVVFMIIKGKLYSR